MVVASGIRNPHYKFFMDIAEIVHTIVLPTNTRLIIDSITYLVITYCNTIPCSCDYFFLKPCISTYSHGFSFHVYCFY